MTNQPSMDPKVREAINAAMDNKWQEALRLNQELIERYPDDIDTLNRLARSLVENGKINEAKRHYKKVLELDKYNKIATKNLIRLTSIRKKDIKDSQIFTSIKGDIFLEEAGKTKTALLEDTAMPSVLAGLRTGDALELSPSKTSVTVLTKEGERVGKFADEIGRKIARDIRLGSKFDVIVRSSTIGNKDKKSANPQVSVFVRETIRSPKVPSPPFPTQSSGFTPYVREEAMNLLSNQSPIPTEADDNIEEVEISTLHPSEDSDNSYDDEDGNEPDEADDIDETR